MTKVGEAYRCNVCGNIVVVMNAGAGELSCCGEPMQLIVPNSTDAAKEKHVPVIEKTDDGYKVTVGSVVHPMEADHYIQWIALMTDDGVSYEIMPKPGDAPIFSVKTSAKAVGAMEYCNKHGLWAVNQ